MADLQESYTRAMIVLCYDCSVLRLFCAMIVLCYDVFTFHVFVASRLPSATMYVCAFSQDILHLAIYLCG